MFNKQNGIIYDLEIKTCIPDPNKPNDPNYRYCKGWEDYSEMGISTLCAYDILTKRYHIFCDDNRDKFQQLVDRADFLVTFAGLKFDNNVLGACWGIYMPKKKNYDIKVHFQGSPGRVPGYGLESCCKANGFLLKTENGALAPKFWQDGKIGTVIDYCLNDVYMTRRLMNNVLMEKPLIDPTTLQEVTLTSVEKGVV